MKFQKYRVLIIDGDIFSQKIITKILHTEYEKIILQNLHGQKCQRFSLICSTVRTSSKNTTTTYSIQF